MVFFSAVFAARAPAMGNSADRAWQLSQLVEGVLTACNPSHGSLSCVETNCVSFASAQARKLNRSVCFSFPHEVGYFVGAPTMVGHCVSKQIGLPTVRFSLAGSSLPGRRARRARFPTCGVVRVAGYSVVWDCDPTPISPKEHQKERCGHFSVAALLHYVLWCALEYSVVGRISCHVPYDSTRTNVCQWPFAENFLLLLPLLN